MNSSVADVVVSEAVPRRGAGDLVVVEFAGWTVHVCGVLITVPGQSMTGKAIQDLRVCLDAAHQMAGVRIDSAAPQWDASIAEAVLSTLRAARRHAQRCWRRKSHDIYHCTSAAWQQSGMGVPYTLLIRALRAALPAQMTLMDFNDDADCAQIVALYGRAIAVVSERMHTQAASSSLSRPALGRGSRTPSVSQDAGPGFSHLPGASSSSTGVAS